MRRAAKREPSQGFALVEALASLVVVGMIGLMLVAGMTTGHRVWDRIDTREAAGETIESAQTILRDRIEQAFPQTLYDENPPYVDLRGTAQDLIFLANSPESQRPAPLRRYTLSLDTAGNLLLSSISDAAPAESAVVRREILLRGVRQIDLAYFGPLPLDPQRHWRGTWRDQATLPEMVRLRVAFEPNDPRIWPDLVVRPRATIDSACLLNTVTHHCKGRI
jgi:general secretion pathway protein J